MHIPTVQSLFCLSLLAAPYASAIPLDENLQPRAATTCNASNVKTLKNANKQPVTYCKSWLASKHSKSTVKGLTVAQVSNACKCIQASASSSSAAAAKKTSTAQKKIATVKKVLSTTKKSTSTKKATTSTKKVTSSKKATTSSKKTTSSAKKATTSTKRVTTSKKATSSTKKTTSSKKPTTSSKASTSPKSTAHTSSSSKKTATISATAVSTSLTSEKSTWTPVSTQQSSSSSSSKPTASSSFSTSTIISSSSTLSTISSSSLSSTSSALSSTLSSTTEALSSSLASSSPLSTTSSADNALPTGASLDDQSSDASMTANRKAPNSVTTRSTSNAQTTSSSAASSQTTSASAGSKDAALGSGTNVITNGNFNQGSFANWHGAHAVKTTFSVASLAGDSNYEALVNYSLDPNDNASGQIYQNVTIPAGMAWQLSANVFLGYPNSLPAGVSCVIKYSLGSDNIILEQYGAITSSGATLSDTASGQLSTAFSGRFQIDTYCNSVSSSAASFSLGFGNVQLLISTPTTSTSSIATSTSTSTSVTSSTCAPSVATNTNLVSNGDFASGSLSPWNSGYSTVGNASYSVQARSGTSDNYAVMALTPGSYNEANGQLSQTLQVISGYSYSFSADVYLNAPSGLPSGAVCTITYTVGNTNIYGYETDRVTIDSNNHISDSYNGTIANTDCNAALQIYVDCSGISSPITVGFDNVQLSLQTASGTSTSSPSSTTSSAASATSTSNNLIVNGNFGTGDYTGWALYRLGSPSFAIQGNPNAYVSVVDFPAGGDSNSQAGLMQQAVTVQTGKTYTLSMGLLLNYPSGLAADGSTCSIQVYMVDSNGFGILFAQKSFSNGDAAFQSITGSGSVNSGFDGQFDILLRCYGGAQDIIAGIEDVQVTAS